MAAKFRIPEPGTLLRINVSLRTNEKRHPRDQFGRDRVFIPKDDYVMFLSYSHDCKEELQWNQSDYKYTFLWQDKIWTSTWMIAPPERFFTEFVTVVTDLTQENNDKP